MPVQYVSRGRETGPADIFVATPSGGQPKPNYIAAWGLTASDLEKHGIAFDYLLHFGDCHVDDARNACIRNFMESGCKRLLFIDDDVGWTPEDFLNFIRHDRDVVAAVYPKKQDEPDYPVMEAAGPLLADADGLVKVRGVPAGFLMISRAAIERMIAKSVPYVLNSEGTTYTIFERGIVGGRRWSGDYYFCRKWAELGGEIFVDPSMPLTHCGLQTWSGVLGEHWRRKHHVFDPHLDAAFKMLIQGNASDSVFDVITGKWHMLSAVANVPMGDSFEAQLDMVKLCYRRALEAKGPILETGSGITTLVMSIAALKSGVELWTLEHDWSWFCAIRDLIKRYKLKQSRLCYAPLREQPNGMAWYELVSELPAKFDLVICDGPPRYMSDRGALWRVYGDKIADADWIIDDIGEPEKYKAWGRNVDMQGRFAVVTKP